MRSLDNLQTMRTRRELLAGVGAAIALAGCTGDGDEDGTASPPSGTSQSATTSQTGRATTETPRETTTLPEEGTTTEGPPEDTPSGTPEPETDPLSFEEIYEEEMVLDYVGREVDWNQVRNELEDDHDLENPTVSSDFIEDLAGHAGKQVGSREGAAALAYGLYNEFDIGTDQVIVDARTLNSGTTGPMASILIQQDNGGVVKDMYRPGGQAQNPDEYEESAWYKNHYETEVGGADQDPKDAWSVSDTDTFNPLHYEGINARIDEFGGRSNISDSEWASAWEEWMAQIQDVAVGYLTDDDINMVVTEETHEYISQKEQEPDMEHVKQISTKYHNVDLGESEYLRAHAEDGELTFDITTDWEPSYGWAEAPAQ